MMKSETIMAECHKMIARDADALTKASDLVTIARLQGRIHALNDVLNLPETLFDDPNKRIGDDAGQAVY